MNPFEIAASNARRRRFVAGLYPIVPRTVVYAGMRGKKDLKEFLKEEKLSNPTCSHRCPCGDEARNYFAFSKDVEGFLCVCDVCATHLRSKCRKCGQRSIKNSYLCISCTNFQRAKRERGELAQLNRQKKRRLSREIDNDPRRNYLRFKRQCERDYKNRFGFF